MPIPLSPSIQYLRDLVELVESHPYSCFAITFTTFIAIALLIQGVCHLVTTTIACIRYKEINPRNENVH